MPLIDITPNTPIEPTKEQKLNETKSTIKNISKNMFETIVKRHQFVWDMIWDNSRGLTPQEVVDAFGSDAYELFVFSLNIQTLLAQANINYSFMSTPNEFVINPDGTVTIGELKVTEEPSGDITEEPSGDITEEPSGGITEEPSGGITEEPSM